MSVDTERAADLDDLMARLTATDHRYRYSVAWIDLLARGARDGPRGPDPRRPRAAGRAARAAAARDDPLAFRPARLPGRPRLRARKGCSAGRRWGSSTSSGTARRPARGPASSSGSPPSSTRWTGVPHWNRVYGRGGFVQYQFVVGHGQEETLRRIVRRISERRCPSFLAVLKRFGERRSGLAVLPGARLDPGPGHPGRPARPRRASSTSWTRRWRRPAAGSTSPRTPGCGPNCWPRCTRGSTTSGRCAPELRPARRLHLGPVPPARPCSPRCRPPVPRPRPRSSLMKDAFGTPQSLLVLGGTSEIGAGHRAPADRPPHPHGLARRTARRPPWTRPPSELRALGADVRTVAFDALDPDVPRGGARQGLRRGRHRHGAAGLRGPRRPGARRAGAGRGGAGRADQLHGRGVGRPGVRAARCRRRGTARWWCSPRSPASGPAAPNFIYGSSKAGLDAFAQGLGDALYGTGVHVMVVRPGFVRVRG